MAAKRLCCRMFDKVVLMEETKPIDQTFILKVQKCFSSRANLCSTEVNRLHRLFCLLFHLHSSLNDFPRRYCRCQSIL